MPTTNRPKGKGRTSRPHVAILGAIVLVAILVILGQRLLDPGLAGPPRCTFTTSGGTSFDLTTEQARNAATIAAMAAKRDLPPRAATIGVATAMQESKLRNLAGGDRDSVGLFQQRPSQGWGTAAQIRNTVYATGKFYDALVKVPRWQTLPLTEAAQKVQLSAAPNAYAQHETEAAAFAEPLTGVRPEGVGCRLKDAAAGPTAEQVRAQLETETGLTADIAGGVLALESPDRRRAAAAAAWAVASADDLGVREVRLGNKVWRRSTSTDALIWAPTGDAAREGAVRIALLHR